jgi:Fanconi anemia group J protein
MIQHLTVTISISYSAVTLQALGRCIRHRSDYGSIILLDERLQDSRPQSNLSRWLRDSVIIPQSFQEAHERLSRFFSERAEVAASAAAAEKSAALKAEMVTHSKGGCTGASPEEAAVRSYESCITAHYLAGFGLCGVQKATSLKKKNGLSATSLDLERTTKWT